MTSTIKVDNIQDQDGNNIINENANTITILVQVAIPLLLHAVQVKQDSVEQEQ